MAGRVVGLWAGGASPACPAKGATLVSKGLAMALSGDVSQSARGATMLLRGLAMAGALGPLGAGVAAAAALAGALILIKKNAEAAREAEEKHTQEIKNI